MPVVHLPSPASEAAFSRIVRFRPGQQVGFEVRRMIVSSNQIGVVMLRRDVEAAVPGADTDVYRAADALAVVATQAGGTNSADLDGELLVAGQVAFAGFMAFASDVTLTLVGRFVRLSTIDLAMAIRRSGTEGG